MTHRIAFALAALSLCAVPAFAQDAAPTPPAGKTVWDGVYTADQAIRGQALYESNCSVCHGAMLGGGDMAPSLSGSEFLGRWNSQAASDLFDRIHSTMPPDDPGSIGSASTADIEAYIFSQNQLPAGSTELPGDQQLQQQIKILSLKP